MWLYGLGPVKVSYNLAKFRGHRHFDKRYKSFCLSGDFGRPSNQSVTKWLYGLEPLNVSHHTNRFAGHRHCGNGDVIV